MSPDNSEEVQSRLNVPIFWFVFLAFAVAPKRSAMARLTPFRNFRESWNSNELIAERSVTLSSALQKQAIGRQQI